MTTPPMVIAVHGGVGQVVTTTATPAAANNSSDATMLNM
jgi:hypothetical protein